MEELFMTESGQAGESSIERRRASGLHLGRPTEPEAGRAKTPSLEQHEPSPRLTNNAAYPDRIRRKYYVVTVEPSERSAGREARVYTDAKAEYLAFKDGGDRLTTRLEAAEIARDMAIVAAHRGWQAVAVRGSRPFRREAWLEASSRGLDVTGYEPTPLDREVLTRRVAGLAPTGRGVTDQADAQGVRAPQQPFSTRQDYDAGVTGNLIAIGEAPYQDRPNAKPTGFVDLGLDDGRVHRVWGAGLAKVVEEAKVEIGDRIALRRDGMQTVSVPVRSVDAATGAASIETQDVQRNRWTITADRFRSLDRTEAVRDPALASAHSQLAVLERALETKFPQDAHTRTTVIDAARERVVEHLAQGRRFRQAEVRMSEQVVARDAAGRIPRQERQAMRERGRER